MFSLCLPLGFALLVRKLLYFCPLSDDPRHARPHNRVQTSPTPSPEGRTPKDPGAAARSAVAASARPHHGLTTAHEQARGRRGAPPTTDPPAHSLAALSRPPSRSAPFPLGLSSRRLSSVCERKTAPLAISVSQIILRLDVQIGVEMQVSFSARHILLHRPPVLLFSPNSGPFEGDLPPLWWPFRGSPWGRSRERPPHRPRDGLMDAPPASHPRTVFPQPGNVRLQLQETSLNLLLFSRSSDARWYFSEPTFPPSRAHFPYLQLLLPLWAIQAKTRQ